VFYGLSINPTLRAVVANVEMSPSRLLDRQLARLSGVPLTTIRRRHVVPDDVEKTRKALTRISQVVPRLGFVKAPSRLNVVTCILGANKLMPSRQSGGNTSDRIRF